MGRLYTVAEEARQEARTARLGPWPLRRQGTFEDRKVRVVEAEPTEGFPAAEDAVWTVEDLRTKERFQVSPYSPDLTVGKECVTCPTVIRRPHLAAGEPERCRRCSDS